MKKISLLFVGIATLLLTSCEKGTIIKNELDGETWKVVSVTTVHGSNSSTDSDPEESFAFDKDGGTGKCTSGNNVQSFTWSVTESTITVVTTSGNYSNSTSYTVTKSGWNKQTWEYRFTWGNEEYIVTMEVEKQ